MSVLIRLSCAACASLFIAAAGASPLDADSADADAAPAAVVSDVHVFVVQRDGSVDEHDVDVAREHRERYR